MSTTNMNTTSQQNTFDASYPSICIPWVFPNIRESRVRGVFENLPGFYRGCIAKVDMVKKRDARGKDCQIVFIHFDKWPMSEEAQDVRKTLLSEEEICVVYQDPWF